MKRLKIFLFLKAGELWLVCKIAAAIIVLIVAIFAVLALIGYLVSLARPTWLAIWMDSTEDPLLVAYYCLGILAFCIVAAVAGICIGLPHWLYRNWVKAGELARDRP